jgi:hypothetical protein
MVFNWMQMMKDESLQNQLRESLWRRKPAGAGQADLRPQPEAAADLELEARLTDALSRLPEATVASNFTSRVMQAIELDEVRPARTWNWHLLLPRVAIASAVLVLASLAWQHHEQNLQRATLARNVALMAEAQPVPSMEALKNFDTIQRMSQPHADEELIALLQ